MKCQLEYRVIGKDNFNWTKITCDGCKKELNEEGDEFIWGIESCCGGGCSRALCRECVLEAAKHFPERKPNKIQPK